MEEVKFLKGNINNLPNELNDNTIYVATASTPNDSSKLIIGKKEWLSREYIDDHISICVTQEEFSDVKDKANTAIQAKDLKTINGETLTGDGDISIDISLYELVSELPTENINPNKIYLLLSKNSGDTNHYVEYLYHEDIGWEILGEYKAEVDLSEYQKTADADKKYMKLENGKATVSISNNGSMNNFCDNGQAFNAVRECPNSLTNYTINAAAFGVKSDGTTGFSHKKYDSFDASTGTYKGARNTAVLTFAGNLGLRYAKNTGSAADATEAMYRYVGVIDSPDEFQRVYSKAQVDTLISQMKTILSRLGATGDEINSITI